MSRKPFILIADDDQEDRFLLSTAFEEIGRSEDIYLVENGLQVFKYLDDSVKQDRVPSLIVLDLNMPVLNGIETLAKLKSDTRYSNIPVIIYSTSIHEVEKEKCLKIGAAEFIRKPARFNQTVAAAQFMHEFSTIEK